MLDELSKAVGARPDHQVRGLDTLRFAAAAWVGISHGAGLPFGSYDHPVAQFLASAQTSVFDGAAAVLVFFVISGFCIHYAYATGRPFNTGAFLSRRLIRLSVPVLAISLLAWLCGPMALGGLKAVLWSLYCELIYYALYPVLRHGFARFGLRPIILLACIASLSLIVGNWSYQFYDQFPIWAIWLVASPAWLLGCRLAEQMAAGRAGLAPPRPAPSRHEIWAWRLGAVAYGSVALILVFHSPWPLGYPILLSPFAFIAAAWVEREVAWFQHHPPARLLEWAGAWSYSLYLVHLVAMTLVMIDPARPILSWIARLAAVLVGSYVFYRLVERPAQQLARWVSHLFLPRSPDSRLSEQNV